MSNTKQQIEGIVRDYDTWCLCGNDECLKSMNFIQAVEAIGRLFTEARIEELRLHATDWVEISENGVINPSVVYDRIAELKSQLSKEEK